LRGFLINLWFSSSNFILQTQLAQPHLNPTSNTYHSKILKRSRTLNIRQRLLQILQLQLNPTLRLLRILHSLRLKRLNGLHLPINIIRRGLEVAEVLLDLVDDGLVLQDRAVVREVDLGGLFGELLHSAAGVFVALLEGLEGGGGLATEAEGAGYFGPVELEGCASL
jgi:hypothetical protein